MPKIDLTTCLGGEKSRMLGKFGLHTQRLSVGGELPKVLNHLEMCEENRRKKTSSIDKKAWWSKPTTLTKHLPEAFRTS